MKKKVSLLVLFVSMLFNFMNAQTFTQTANIYPANITAGDEFGSSVAIDADFMAIGAYYFNNASTSPGYGSVYIWKDDGTTWSEFQQIIPSSAYNGDQFGNAVALSGNNLIIGAWNGSTDGDHNPGNIYFYHYDGTSWTDESKWVCGINDYDLGYGTSVGIYGDYAIVGAPGISSNDGAAYVYYRNAGTWEFQQSLPHTNTGESYFGSSVAIFDNIAFVGARGENKVHIFSRSGTTWSETATLSPTTGGVSFGTSLSYDGTSLIVGDEGDNSAYIFTFDGTNWNRQKIIPSDGSTYDHFGKSVSISGNYAIVGAWAKNSMTGASYIFKNTSGTWSQLQKMTASNGDSNDRFGTSVAIQNSTALVGAFYDNITGAESGSAYIFEMPPPPAPTITSQPQNTSVCEGSTTTFSITSTNTTSYQWYGAGGALTDGGDISGATTNQLSIANTEQADEGNYYCIVTGDGGSLQSNNAALTVDELITATAGADISVCEDYADLSANSPSPGLGTWTLVSGGGTISTPDSNNTDVSNLLPGENTFRWTITNGACISYDDVIVNYDIPLADAGSPQSINTTSTTLDAVQPAADESGVWTVVSGTGIFADATLYNTQVSELSEGDNVFLWTVSNGTCINEDSVTITVDLSENIIDNDNAFTVTPNPSNGVFYVNGNSLDDADIKIFDINGKTIYNSSLKKSANKKIDISNCMKGIYFISVKTDSGNIIMKIVIN